MNILELKRSARGYFYREGGDEQNYPTTAPSTLGTYQGDDESRYVKPAPVVVAPPVVAPPPAVTPSPPPVAAGVARNGPSAGQQLAAVIGMTGGGGPNVDIPITQYIEGYESVNLDGTINRYDTQGNFVTTYTSNGSDIVGSFFAGLDSSLGLSKGLTAIGGGLADLDNTLGLSRNAPAIVGLAAAYFLPGIGQALGQSLVNAGVLTGAAATPAMATTIGTALAQTGVSVAQGKSLDEALTNAIISVGTAGLTQAFGADVKSAISQITTNPVAQNAIFKAGTDVVAAVAQGKTGDQIVQGIGNSIVSTVAGAAANELVKTIPGINALPDAAKNVVTSGIAASIQGGDGTKSMLNTALREGTNYVIDAATQTARENAAQEAREATARENAAQAARESAAQEAREATARESAAQATRDQAARDQAARDQASREAAAQAAREQAAQEARDRAAADQADLDRLTNAGLKETTPSPVDGIPAQTTPVTQGAVTGATLPPSGGTGITGGAADASTGTVVTDTTVTDLQNSGLTEGKPGETGMAQTASQTGGTNTANADEWGDLQGAMLKGSSGEPVKLTDAQMTDMVRKGLVFGGGDYNTKQDAANAARLAGYTQFDYDNSIYTMQPGGPTEKALFQAVIDMQPNRGEAFNTARKLLGSDKTFDYKGAAFTTETKEERNARQYNTDAAIQARVDLIPAYGGSRNTQTGTPANVSNTFIDQKTNQVVEDTRVWDAAGNVVSGSLSVADPSKTLQVAGSLVLDAGTQMIDAFTGVGKFLGAIDKNSEFANKVNQLVSFNEAQKPPEVKAESAQFWSNVKNAQGIANTARVVLSSVVDQPLMTGFNIASEMIQTLGTLGAGTGVKYASALLKAAPALSAKLGIGVDAVLNIGESAGATYNESYKKALASVGAQVRDGSMTAAQAEAYAEDTAGKTFLAAAGITGAVILLPGGNALAKQVLGSGAENAAMKASFKEAIKADAAKAGYDLAAKTTIKEAGSEGAEAFAIEAANQKILSPDADYNWKDLVTTPMLEMIYGGGHSAAIASADIAVSNFQDKLIASGATQAEVDSLTKKVGDLVKSGGASTSAIDNVKAEASNLLGSIGYRIDPTLDLMSDQFFSGVVSQEVASEMSVAGMSPEQVAQNLTSAVSHVEAGNRIDPIYVDPFFTDESEAREIARELGYTNPSQQVLDSLVGQTSEADTAKKLDAVANAQEMMSALGLDLSDQDAISLANKITASSDATGIDEFLSRFGVTTEGVGTTPKPGDANDFLNQTGVTTGATTGSTGTVLSTDPTNNTALVVNSSGATTVVDNTNNTLKVGDTVPTAPATTTPTATPATTPATTPTATQTTSTPLTTEQKNKIISDAIAKTPSGSSSADIANAINTAALGTKLTDAENRLDAAIQSAKAIGLQGDAALQSGLNTVAADLGIAKTELLAQIGKSENDLRNEFQTGLGGVTTDIAKTRTDLTAAIAANEANGLTRDQATQKAIDDVAGQLGTTKTDLLAQLGTTEAALNTQIAGVKTDLASQLNAQGQLFMDSLVQQGMNQQEALETAIAAQTKLVTEGQAATQTALGELSAAQQQEVADRVAAGQATDAAIAAVKATVETGQAATQTALGELSAAQQKEVADRVAAGQETNAAIADVKAAVETGQAALESKLTTQGKEFMDALVAQGMDQKTALETAMAAQTKLVTEGQNATNLRIDELVKQGMTYQQATQKAITEMSTGFTTQMTDAEKRRADAASAWEAQRQLDLTEAEKKRDLDRQADLDRAAEAEKARQIEITNQKAREAANLKTIQTGQIRGQMQTGLQGLMGGLQQQATQMAAPGVVETVKATPGFSFDSPLNVGFFGGYESQKAPTKDKESLKIATGGYLDDLLEAIR